VGDLGGGWALRGGRSADDVTTLACCGAHTSEHRAPNIRTSEQHEHNATRFSGIERFIISRPLLPPAALLLFCWPTSSIKAATTIAMFKFRFRCARNPFLVCSLCLALYFLRLYAAVICAIYVILWALPLFDVVYSRKFGAPYRGNCDLGVAKVGSQRPIGSPEIYR